MYLGDCILGANVDLAFTTVNTSGAPTQLAGSPAVAAYADNGTTEITAGITLTVDFDARTGLNHVRVAATSGNGYAAGSVYQLVITAGTVGGTSVVGYVVGSFSIEKRNGNVSHFGGTAGTFASGRPEVNTSHWGGTAVASAVILAAANIASNAFTAAKFASGAFDAVWERATSALTTAGTIGKLLVDNINATISSRAAATLFTGITSVAEWLGLIAGKQTGNSTARTEIRATGAGSGTFDETTDSQEAIRDRGDTAWTTATGFSTHSAADVWAVATRTLTAFDASFKTGYALSAAGIQAIWDALTSALTTASSIGKLLVDNINATISSRSTLSEANVRTAVGLASANLDTQLDALPTATENADALLARDIGSGSNAGSLNERTVRSALRFNRNKFTISGGTLTVYREDDTTVAFTAVITQTAGDPVSASDPA